MANAQSHVDTLLDDIVTYIEYLKNAHHLQITVHHLEQRLPAYFDRILPYNVHENPVCLYLKHTRDIWQCCIDRQSKVQAKAENGPYFGTCWMGMGEYVFPIRDDAQKTVGFLSISGYRGNPEKRAAQFEKVCARYGLNRQDLERLYELYARGEKPSMQEMRALISPLCSQFTLLLIYLKDLDAEKTHYATNSETFYMLIRRYLERHYDEINSLEELAAQFNCSTSYLSRTIRHYAHCSYRTYVNRGKVRMAKMYLENTELSVQEIGSQLGFADSNYFSTVFHREVGCSPRQWRQAHGRET